MNASVRAPEHGSSKDEPLKFVPKKTRTPEPGSAPAGTSPLDEDAELLRSAAHPASTDDAAPAHGNAAEPPWRRSRPRNSGGSRTSGAVFAGDIAVTELRTQLALVPDRLPEPPPPSGGSALVWAGRLTGVAVVVAVGFAGYRWGSSPDTPFQLPQLWPSPTVPDQQVTAAPQVTPQTAPHDPVGGLTIINAVPAVYPPLAKAGPPPTAGRTFRQLTVGAAATTQQADEVVRLTIAAPDAGPNATVVIGGLASGSVLSPGREVTPNTWRLSIEELPGVTVAPPRGFVGTMVLTVELRLADSSVGDHKTLQLEWQSRGIAAKPPQFPQRQHDTAEIALMLKRGDELMTNGDVAAARLMYQRAAEAGEAIAAFMLAETYDPLVLGKGGIAPNIGLAQTWYAKARDLGATQAAERLERLGYQSAEP
jgi:hypothetical protein